MSILQADIVDSVGIERETGHVVLTLVDDLDWDQAQEHLQALERKVNCYLDFIQSGEVFRCLEEVAGRSVPISTPVKVSIHAQHPVPREYWELMDYLRAELLSDGIGMEWLLTEQAPGDPRSFQ